MWKLRKFTLTIFWQKFRESNVYTKGLISRIFLWCEWFFFFFHTVKYQRKISIPLISDPNLVLHSFWWHGLCVRTSRAWRSPHNSSPISPHGICMIPWGIFQSWGHWPFAWSWWLLQQHNFVEAFFRNRLFRFSFWSKISKKLRVKFLFFYTVY